MSKIKTAIVIEDSKVSSAFIANVLETLSFDVVLQIYSIHEYKEKMRKSNLSPDLICIDYNLPDGTGDEIIDFNEVIGINTPAVFFTGSYKVSDLITMSETKARGIANKENIIEIKELLYKVLNKNNNEKYFGSSICNLLLRFERDTVKLTYKEKKVFKLLVAGFSASEISDLMHIEKRTLYRKKRYINSKLDANIQKKYYDNYIDIS